MCKQSGGTPWVVAAFFEIYKLMRDCDKTNTSDSCLTPVTVVCQENYFVYLEVDICWKMWLMIVDVGRDLSFLFYNLTFYVGILVYFELFQVEYH